MLYYIGKVTFSDIVPGLSEAADAIAAKANENAAAIGKAQDGVAWLQKKAAAAQEEVTRAGQALSAATDILSDAQRILDEATSLTNKLANALADSGIYYFQYVGKMNEFSSDLVSYGFNLGLPDKQPDGGNEAVAASIIIVGGDGGLVASGEKIARLFDQIGGNGEYIKGLYTAEAQE